MQESGLGTSVRYTTLLSIFALSGLILFLINFLSITDIGILRLDHSKTEIISRADSILRKMGYTENRDYPSITAIYNTPLVDTIGIVVNQYLDQDYSFLQFSGESSG
jgi:hypothetical protein